MAVIALYQFDDNGNVAEDSALDNGAQNGFYLNGASSHDGQARFDGCNDAVKIIPDDAFQMDRGTLDIQFTTTSRCMHSTQTVLSRDSIGSTDGGYHIDIRPDGSVKVVHETPDGAQYFSTGSGFFGNCDTIKVTYSWDVETGGKLEISNLTSGEIFEAPVPAGLTMDMSDTWQNEPWVVGAGQGSSLPHSYSPLSQHFQGKVDYLQFSDTVDNCGPVSDGYVDGTAGGDLIDTTYLGDPDGDRIDAGDAILPGAAPDDDFVRAGAGNDTVFAGLGDDIVKGGAGDDVIHGGAGADTLYGGDDRDTFVVGGSTDGFGDQIDGGEGGCDFDTLDLRGSGPLRVNYNPDNAENGLVEFLDGDGNVTGSLTFTNIENVVPCFTPGTLIATPRGEVPVETLRPGDRVITRDNGIQEIRWTGAKEMSWRDLSLNPHLKPILIRKGSLGNGLPEQDMMVSPNHRVLVANDRTALYFDEHEVLVSAKHLVAGKGVHSVDSIGTTYIHFMFDRHEVVLSNGAWTESFQPGDYTLKGMGNAQRNEIYELFPDLKTAEGIDAYGAARRTLKKHEARLLVR